jgi:hypothetical protein
MKRSMRRIETGRVPAGYGSASALPQSDRANLIPASSPDFDRVLESLEAAEVGHRLRRRLCRTRA